MQKNRDNGFAQCNWQSLLQRSLTQPDQIPNQFVTPDMYRTTAVYPMRINPYVMALIEKKGMTIARQFFPNGLELQDELGLADPLAEERDSPVPCITHRYPDRVLFTVSNECAAYCRFCTRKRKVGKWPAIQKKDLERGIAYIQSKPQIRDVLLSGGDPLLLSDEKIDWLLSEIRQIEHVEIIRIGSRVPGVLPQRITQDLMDVLKQYSPLYLNLHFNHADEITDEAAAACGCLADAGLVLGSQTVLLQGVNDSVEAIGDLMRALLKIRVKPYYLMQGDLTRGTDHFRTPLETGIRILRQLRGNLSGMAIPTLVLDLPDGGGKVPLSPDFSAGETEKGHCFFNFQGRKIMYPDPVLSF